jgi:hypothetical protein
MLYRYLGFAAAVALAAGASSCGKDSTSAPPATPPSVSGISETLVSPGDTLIVSGHDFATPASANRVRFTNPLGVSTPFAGSATSLSVIVDQDATTGKITVTSNGLSAPGPSVDVRRGIGDFFVYGGLGDTVSLPNPTVTTSYLVITMATNPKLPYTDDASYEIHTQSTVPSPVASVASRPRSGSDVVDANEAFDAWRWDQARKVLDELGTPSPPSPAKASSLAAPQAFKQFYVLNTPYAPSLADPAYYDHIWAELRYDGNRCQIYTDVDSVATGNFSYAELRTMGQTFDNSIDATNVQYFGDYSDIDGNDGKVIIVITPVVDRMPVSDGFIAGFFLFMDLLSNAPAGTSNHGEIFYMLTKTSGHLPDSEALNLDIATTAHEHEHMISFSHRLFNEGGVLQETWLEEGMAHMAENLNGFHDQNILRANKYLDAPGSTSLEYNGGLSLAQRGGMFLFLRLMTDRYGDGILKQIVQSRCSGRSCIQDVSGEDFYELVAEFLATLYMSGKGITADPRFEYQSIDLADFHPVSVSSWVAGQNTAGVVKRSTGVFYMFTGTLNTTSKFTFIDAFGNARLRNAIVRIQ